MTPPSRVPSVSVEFYGVPRRRAGAGRAAVFAANLADALAGLARQFPGLAADVIDGASGRLRPEYRVSLNGESFPSDPGTPLAEGDVLILLSADVGG